MNQYTALRIATIALLCASCSHKDEPDSIPAPENISIRLASIMNDDETQSYTYDDNGNIVDYSLLFTNDTQRQTVKATYAYSRPNTIDINVKSEHCNYITTYEESLSLNKNGFAEKGEGIWTVYIDGNVYVQKGYSREFTYNLDNELIFIKFSEWHIRDTERKNEWTWTNRLTWADGNITEYINYNGHSHPYITETYEYFDVTIKNQVISFPDIDFYYRPLQQTGVLGKIPKNLIKQITRVSDTGSTDITKYSYVPIPDSKPALMQSYAIQRNDQPINYFKINWKRIDNSN